MSQSRKHQPLVNMAQRIKTHSTDVAKSFDYESECLLVVAHATQQKDHFRYKVSFFADIVGLLTQDL
jgi:hypothetical protein